MFYKKASNEICTSEYAKDDKDDKIKKQIDVLFTYRLIIHILSNHAQAIKYSFITQKYAIHHGNI